jgi:hypothetical protein
MTIKIELSEEDLKQLILREVRSRINDDNLTLSEVKIEVKSKQNYKSEWEIAEFRATYLGAN